MLFIYDVVGWMVGWSAFVRSFVRVGAARASLGWQAGRRLICLLLLVVVVVVVVLRPAGRTCPADVQASIESARARHSRAARMK